MPKNLRDEMHGQISAVKALHHRDLEEGFGNVYIPKALTKKYPNASKATGWQWVFPAKLRSHNPRSGIKIADKVSKEHRTIFKGLEQNDSYYRL